MPFCSVPSKVLSPVKCKGYRHPMNGCVNCYCKCYTYVNYPVKTGTAKVLPR